MDSFISWAGGKKALRGKVIKEFPEKGTFGSYVEVFGGAGWVLFAAEKHALKEVYNDIIPDETENSLGQSISVNEEITDRSEWNESESVSQNDTVSENILQTEKELIPEAATEESEPQTISENETEIISEKKIISKVKIPTNTHVYLDPENLAGKGGIFSDSYEVINYGNSFSSI